MQNLNGQSLPELDSASGPVAHYLRAILLELQWQRETRRSAVVELTPTPATPPPIAPDFDEPHLSAYARRSRGSRK